MIDFSNAEIRYKDYSGTEEKLSIFYNNKYYMLKYPKKLSTNRTGEEHSRYSNNPISEHIGCEIFKSIGMPAQNTLLGTYNDSLVVACEDFMLNNPSRYDNKWQMIEFGQAKTGISRDFRKEDLPTIDDIYHIAVTHPSISKIADMAIERYWDTFVVDALIGNYDRHTGNWGYIKNVESGEIELAPIYDCGSTLYARYDDTDLANIIKDKALANDMVMTKIMPALTIKGHRVKYHEYMNAHTNLDLDASLANIIPKIDFDKIYAIINNTEGVSEIRKNFLVFIIQYRYERILLPAYSGLQKKCN